MIYVYLGLLILSLLFLVYCLYSLEINRKLNIKKRSFAIRPSRNKFFAILCINVLLIITFGGLFVYKLINRREIPVISSDEVIRGNPVSQTTPITILSNDISYLDYDNGEFDKNAYYYVNENNFYRYDIKTLELTSIEVKHKDFKLVKDSIIFYYEEIIDEEIKTHLEIYNKKSLLIEKEILIDGSLKNCFGYSSFFLGNTINVLVESYNVKNLDKIGYVVTKYIYPDEEDSKIEKVEAEKAYIENILKPKYHNYDRVIIQVQCSLTSDAIETKAICLSDYYVANVDGYFYIFCNTYGKDHYENESFVLKYNPIDLDINDYHMFANIIYSSPSCYREGTTTYMAFVMYNMAYDNYQLVKMDHNLEVIEIKETYLDTQARIVGSKEKNLLVFDNKVVSYDNVIYYNNEIIINYSVDVSKKKIIIEECDITNKVINKYNLIFEDNFESASITSIVKCDKDYLLIYKIDDKNGYIKYPEYQEELLMDDEITEDKNIKINEIDINAEILSQDKYYIMNKMLLIISKNDENEEEITIKEINSLFNEKESGE